MKIFYILIILSVSTVSFSLPMLDESGFRYKTHLPNTMQQHVVVYPDSDDEKKFWWVPYYIEIQKNPITKFPLLTWSAYVDHPKISIVSGLTPFPSITISSVKKSISEDSGVPIDEIKLTPLKFTNIQLTLEFKDIYEIAFGSWRPRTSLVARFVPETLELSDYANKSLLLAYENDFAGLKLRLQYTGEILAKLAPSSLGRKFKNNCIINILSDGNELMAIASQNISEKKLKRYVSKIENQCVTQVIERGNIKLGEVWRYWPKGLVEAGFMKHDPQGNGYLVSSINELLNLSRQELGIFHFELPGSVRLFPVTFSTFVLDIHPSEF